MNMRIQRGAAASIVSGEASLWEVGLLILNGMAMCLSSIYGSFFTSEEEETLQEEEKNQKKRKGKKKKKGMNGRHHL